MSEGTNSPPYPKVIIWLHQGTYYVLVEAWKRAKKAKDLAQAGDLAAEEVGHPFSIHYRNPADIPPEFWPITRKRKES